MPPIYEFECNKAHPTIEEMVPMGTKHVVCRHCMQEFGAPKSMPYFAERVLSPTRTNFVFADVGRTSRKRK